MTVINISPRYPLGACDRRNETPVKFSNELLERRLIDVIGKRLFFCCFHNEALLVVRSARYKKILPKIPLNDWCSYVSKYLTSIEIKEFIKTEYIKTVILIVLLITHIIFCDIPCKTFFLHLHFISYLLVIYLAVFVNLLMIIPGELKVWQ